MSGYVGAFGKARLVTAAGGRTEIVISVDQHYNPKFRGYFQDKDVVVTLSQHPKGHGIVVIEEKAEELSDPENKAPYGKYYKELYRYYWFNNPHACLWFGTDEDFREFVQRQPSCLSEEFDHFVNGEGRSIYAEPTGKKRIFTGIPLTSAENDQSDSYFQGEEFFFKKASEYRIQWVKSIIYKDLGVDSLGKVKPTDFLVYATQKGFIKTLPPVMKTDRELSKW